MGMSSDIARQRVTRNKINTIFSQWKKINERFFLKQNKTNNLNSNNKLTDKLSSD